MRLVHRVLKPLFDPSLYLAPIDPPAKEKASKHTKRIIVIESWLTSVSDFIHFWLPIRARTRIATNVSISE